MSYPGPLTHVSPSQIYHSEYEIFFSRPTSGHRGLQASSLIIIWSALFSALAGSLFAVRLVDVRSSVIIAMAGTLGANNATLESPATFVAAAGVRYLIESLSNLEYNTDGINCKEHRSWK